MCKNLSGERLRIRAFADINLYVSTGYACMCVIKGVAAPGGADGRGVGRGGTSGGDRGGARVGSEGGRSPGG